MRPTVSHLSSTVKSRKTWLTSTALAATLAFMPHVAFATPTTTELPTAYTPVSGTFNPLVVSTSPTSASMTINQTSDRGVINWNTFNIGSAATVNFSQPTSGSWTVNRVVGPGTDPADIEGHLNANGNIMVLDRNGVLFGKNSMTNVNGIVASTGDIDNTKFMNGDTSLVLSNVGSATAKNTAKIDNEGTINAADAGLVAFVAPNVKNKGIINARLGHVAFGTGTKATLDLTGDNLITIAVSDQLKNSLIENSGRNQC